jgi:hypothetical protein
MLLPSSENTSKSYGENHIRIEQEDVVMVREGASGSGTETVGLKRKMKIRVGRGNATRIIICKKFYPFLLQTQKKFRAFRVTAIINSHNSQNQKSKDPLQGIKAFGCMLFGCMLF